MSPQSPFSTSVNSRHQKTSNFCAGLLDEYDALWPFCEVEVIDPTNNAAERALRHGVILRRIQLGTQAEKGNRWIERICTARETCMLQGRSVLGYLVDAPTAAHHHQPTPSLTPNVNECGLAQARTPTAKVTQGTRAPTATPRERLRERIARLLRSTTLLSASDDSRSVGLM